MKKGIMFLLVVFFSVLFFSCDAGDSNNGNEETNPVPALTQISPNEATEGGDGFTLTATGSSFINTSKIVFNNTEKTTTYVSATELTAEISTEDLTLNQMQGGSLSAAETATVPVFVRNPSPGGGDSNSMNFTVKEIVTWEKTYGGGNWETARYCQQTSDGGYIFIGGTSSYGAGQEDMFLVKTDSDGNESWKKAFGGNRDEYAYSGQQTSDGGYILAGYTTTYDVGFFDMFLVKTDSSGNQIWQKSFGGKYWEVANYGQQTSDGGYILVGKTETYGAGDLDFYLVKTDASGNKTWQKTFGGADEDIADSGQQTSDGGYILAGHTYSYGAGYKDIFLVKTDTSGNKTWEKVFGGSKSEIAHAVKQTSDGGYILAGETYSYGAGGKDMILIKTDSSGNKIWQKTFGGSGSDIAHSVQQTSDGGYILAGETYSYGAGSLDMYLVKVDSSGNKTWQNTFGGTTTDKAYFVQQTPDGGYIVAGATKSFGAGGYDLYVAKTNRDGVVID